MSPPPRCASLGTHCRALDVLLRIGSLEEGVTSLDHEATWLLGHTERIAFGDVWTGDGDLYVDAVLQVPCRHLKSSDEGARCGVHGYTGRMPRAPRHPSQPRQLGGNRFNVVDRMKLTTRRFEPPPAPRSLPILATPANPCEGAPCQTSDHRRGAACCRDLQVEIMCTKKQVLLEALVRHRKSPYLCKVEREGDFSIDVEMISACGYLEPGGVACTLHGRTRRDGRSAKPDLCFEWPPKNKGLHPGCVFSGRKKPRRPEPKVIPRNGPIRGS